MPAGFSVPTHHKTHYSNHESVSFKPGKPRPVPRSFIAWLFSDYPRRIWILWYTALASSVIGTAIFLHTTGLAESIMNASRQRASLVYRQFNLQDNSNIRLTASAGLTAIIQTPQNQLVGDSAEGLRFQEVSNAVLSQQVVYSPQEVWSNKSFTRWAVVLQTPPEGEYRVSVHAKYSGTYNFNLNLTGLDGVSQTIMPQNVTLVGGQSQKYTLAFQKNPVSNSRLYQ